MPKYANTYNSIEEAKSKTYYSPAVLTVKDGSEKRTIWKKVQKRDTELKLFGDNLNNIELIENTLTYLNFTSLENNSSVSLSNNIDNKPNIEYSKDKLNWVTWDYSTIPLNEGETVYMKGINPNGFSSPSSSSKYSKFVMTGKISASGNIMSLIDGEEDGTKVIPSNYCYQYMFHDCTSLIEAPELPATTLASGCYYYMFKGCTSLTEAPELPATTLKNNCYQYMFDGCTGLTNAPELPATTLASNCYYYMFWNCKKLTTAPELPATKLADYCYESMFRDCTSLTTVPELPATTLKDYCYQNMFRGCTSLTTAPELPATTLAVRCYGGMFQDCTSLTTATELPAIKLAIYCYNSMFLNCTSLTTGPSVLPATTLASYCYSHMFEGCMGLTEASELPATTLAYGCYFSMFSGCTSLTTGPSVLPATTLAENCYNSMFLNCSKLNYIKVLFTSWTGVTDSTTTWVSGVSSTGTFMKPGDLPEQHGNNYIPSGWTVENLSFVSIDGVKITIDLDKSYSEQGYNTLYSKNIYNPLDGETSDTYKIEDRLPIDGESLYTYCDNFEMYYKIKYHTINSTYGELSKTLFVPEIVNDIKYGDYGYALSLEPITEIKDNAFSLKNVDYIKIPESVTKLGFLGDNTTTTTSMVKKTIEFTKLYDTYVYDISNFKGINGMQTTVQSMDFIFDIVEVPSEYNISSMILKGNSNKGTVTIGIKSNNETIKQQALALNDQYTIIDFHYLTAVFIDGIETKIDISKTYFEQGLSSVYSQPTCAEGEDKEMYNVSNRLPILDEEVYSDCIEIKSIIYYDGVEVQVDLNKTYNEQDWDSLGIDYTGAYSQETCTASENPEDFNIGGRLPVVMESVYSHCEQLQVFELLYGTSDGLIGTFDSTKFTPTFVDNVYENAIGKLIFDVAPTAIASSAVNGNNVNYIKIPDTVTSIQQPYMANTAVKTIEFTKLYSTYNKKLIASSLNNGILYLIINVQDVPTGFTMSNLLQKGSSGNKTYKYTYTIYTDNETIKNQSQALNDSYTIVTVKHIDGSAW